MLGYQELGATSVRTWRTPAELRSLLQVSGFSVRSRHARLPKHVGVTQSRTEAKMLFTRRPPRAKPGRW